MSAILQFAHSVLPVVGRVAAGAVGCLALYIAMFMYKSERDEWQNRLDAIWVEIDERAKRVGSRFTALVNNVAQRVVRAFDYVFGKETISWKLAAVSVNLSDSFGTLFGIMFDSVSPFERTFGVTYWFIAIVEVGLGALAILSSRRWIHIVCLIPVFTLYGNSILHALERVSSQTPLPYELMNLNSPAALVLSVLTDVYAVVLIRNIHAKLMRAPSILAALFRAGELMLVAIILCPLPRVLGRGIMAHGSYSWQRADIASILAVLAENNALTCLYCIVPGLLLLLLLLHRMLWPITARFTYPLMEFQVVRERKYLIPLGTIAFGLAGITKGTLLDLFGLFK